MSLLDKVKELYQLIPERGLYVCPEQNIRFGNPRVVDINNNGSEKILLNDESYNATLLFSLFNGLRSVLTHRSLTSNFTEQEIDNIEELLYKKRNNLSIDLDGIIVEVESPKDGSSSRNFYFNESLSHLKTRRGYDRHLRPDEIFRIIIECLENPSSKFENINNDFNSTYQWLSAYFQISSNGKELTVFLDPENIKWDNTRYTGGYIIDGNNGEIKCSSKHKFCLEKIIKRFLRGVEIKNIDLWKDVPLSLVNDVNPELVEFLYGKPYDILPTIIKKRGNIHLPYADEGSPVGIIYSDFSINKCTMCASRGVKTK